MGWARPILPTVRRRRGGAARVSPPTTSPAGTLIATRPASRVLVDANTRTFWSRGAEGPVTLVEAGMRRPWPAPCATGSGALVAAHDRGPRHTGPRPSGNPAFSEALFVELIRGGQHARAFALLAPECQLRWGGAERFAAAHAPGSPPVLLEEREASGRRPPPGPVGRSSPRGLPPPGWPSSTSSTASTPDSDAEALPHRAPGGGGGPLALPLLPGGGGCRLLIVMAVPARSGKGCLYNAAR